MFRPFAWLVPGGAVCILKSRAEYILDFSLFRLGRPACEVIVSGGGTAIGLTPD